MSTPIRTTFAGGELTPLLKFRTDIEKYTSGCQILENMIVLSQGGVTRRMGTEYIGGVKNSLNKTRLIEFARNRELSYVLEFGEYYIRVYQNGSQITVTVGDLTAWAAATNYIPGDWVSSGGVAYLCINPNLNQAPPDVSYWVVQAPYEIWTPYTAVEAFDLQFVQSADVMYIVHPDHEPHKLSTSGAADWTLEKVEFTYAALRDENAEWTEKIGLYTPTAGDPSDYVAGISYPSGALVNDSGTTYAAQRDISEYETNLGLPSAGGTEWAAAGAFTSLTAGSLAALSAAVLVFTDDDIGKYYLLKVPRSDNSLSTALAALNAETATMLVKGTWNLVTHGTWVGTIQVQRSYDDGSTWIMARTYGSTGDRNIDANGEEEEIDVLYKVKMTAYTSGTCTVDFNVEDSYYNRIYKAVDRVSASAMTVQLVESEPTPPVIGSIVRHTTWAEGAWGGDYGYPRAIALFEERLMFGANEKHPLTIWTSKTHDYENLTSGVLDTSAIIYTLSSDRINEIVWMVGHESLMIGTTGDEWKLGASRTDEAMTPTNIKGSRQSSFGSESIRGILLNDTVIYVQRGARKIREMAYNYQVELYESRDLTVMAEHVTSGEVIQILFQDNPYPILWCLMDDGNLCALTYEKEQSVYAWHRHETQGTIESIALIPNGNDDELWITVLRGTSRYVERFKANILIDEISDCWFVDSGLELAMGDPIDIGAAGQTGNTPFTFIIAAHGLVDGNKIRVIEGDDAALWEAFPYKNYIFTVDNVAGTVFTIRNELDTHDWNNNDHPCDFAELQFELVTQTISGLTHLAGETVNVFVDDTLHDDEVVSVGGTITLDRYVNKGIVGLSYTSTVKPTNIESELADGASQGRKKRISQIVLGFHNSVGCTVETDAGVEDIIPWREASDPMDATPPLYSGYKKLKYKDGYDAVACLTATQDVPLPMTLLMMQVWIRTYN